jgi:putative transposase
MATDPKASVPPTTPSQPLPADIAQALASGLDQFTLRELLGWLLSSLGVAERQAYLERSQRDQPNGFYDRALQVGTVPVEVRVPRTRAGDFRPASLPAPSQRGYPEETQALLLSLLASARSLNSVEDALEKMGLSCSRQELERVATDLIEEVELRNSRPLDCDLLALFLDGKYVEFRDGDRLRPACIYVVVGLQRNGRKQVLTCLPRAGRENLEDWKLVLRSLLEHGLRRVLLMVHDDFSGLLPITQSLFPQADVQLCVVHMQRNARNHLNKPDNAEFQQRWRAIKSSRSLEVGNQQFEELCARFLDAYPQFVAELRKKRQHYLAFLAYPEAIRRSLSTTNVVERVNGQLEIMRCDSGGFFHSEDTLKLKLGLAIASLENRCWKSAGRAICSVLAQFNAMFQSRFEDAA